MVMKRIIPILLLLCLVAGAGWLTIQQNLESAQLINENLRIENEQYAISLDKAILQANIANEKIAEQNRLIANYSNQKLDEVESYQEKPTQWREFSSVEELEAWLTENNPVTVHLICGRYPEDGSWIDPDYDCDDYARDLMLKGFEDDYLIPEELADGHVRNFTYIGNEIWIIEPQNNEVWLYKWRRD